jgi:myo-inositol catabolism protein IolC
MTTKRVDKLVAGDHLLHRGDVWTVTRIRVDRPGRKGLRLRPPSDDIKPEDVQWPDETVVEVVP